MKYLDELKKLNLPKGKYAVFGSGPLAVRGIRQFNDIDIIVFPELWEDLKRQGWQEKILPARTNAAEAVVLIKNNMEVVNNWDYGDYTPDIEYLIKTADMIGGVPFVNLEEVNPHTFPRIVLHQNVNTKAVRWRYNKYWDCSRKSKTMRCAERCGGKEMEARFWAAKRF